MDSTQKNNTTLKLYFYFMSLWLLFFLIFILTVDFSTSFSEDEPLIIFVEILKRNWLALSSLLLAFLGLFVAFYIKYIWKDPNNPSFKIKSIKSKNYEYLTFLSTYIIPLICIDLTEIRYVIVLVVLLVVMGFIFIKIDLYYANPTLVLMGYKLYLVEVEGINVPNGIIVITKDKLSIGTSITWRDIGEHIWVAEAINHDRR